MEWRGQPLVGLGLDEEGHEGEFDAVLRLHVCLEAFAQLDQRIQLRNRRCPQCNGGFAESDVLEVFFD